MFFIIIILDATLHKTVIEHDEFVRNETIIELIEDMLDFVVSVYPTHDSFVKPLLNNGTMLPPLLTLTNQNESKIEDISNNNINNNDYIYDKNYFSQNLVESIIISNKRQMNESIMSIGDPMMNVESKKLKNSLNESDMELINDDDDQIKSDNVSLLYFLNIFLIFFNY